MNAPHSTTASTDALIIGGGVAGLTLALKLADHCDVTLIKPAAGASRWAQGGIAAVLAPDDDFAAHINDTLAAGDGLCDPAAVRFTVENGPRAIDWLLECGVAFTPDSSPGARYPYHLTREGGHSARRIIHADDATGRAVVEALNGRIARHTGIRVLTDVRVTDLIQSRDGACQGAWGIDDAGRVQRIMAPHTVLATGGASGLYAHTTAPDPASGHGMMMAATLGARLSNLEFQQFHPTGLYDPDGPAFLISEAVRGEGGRLLNEAGERFMPAVDSRAELAPRDVVARAIDAEIQRGTSGHVWLDVGHLGADAVRRHFPTIVAHCRQRGIDVIRRPIPVVPAAHYSCGGVATDLAGATGVTGLYAVGETACTGLHGANRMASNSLLECLVFARSCARRIVSTPLPPPATMSDFSTLNPKADVDLPALNRLRNTMRRAMSQDVSIVRSQAGLSRAAATLGEAQAELQKHSPALDHPASRRLWQALSLAQLTVHAAGQRRESRGLHFSTDWPEHASTATPSTLTLADLSAGQPRR